MGGAARGHVRSCKLKRGQLQSHHVVACKSRIPTRKSAPQQRRLRTLITNSIFAMDPANASLLNPAGASRPYVAAPSSSSSSSSLPPANFPHDSHPRLSLVSPTRITAGSVVSALIGFSLGATQGGNTAQLRFRAEHAHKMPDSTAGWYLYHKTKNYHAMQGGIREGFKMAARTGFWSCMALSLESTVDRCRGATDMFSTIIASLTVAGAFSIWRTFDFHDLCIH